MAGYSGGIVSAARQMNGRAMVTLAQLWSRSPRGRAVGAALVLAASLAAAVPAAASTARIARITVIPRGWHLTYHNAAEEHPVSIVAMGRSDAWAVGGNVVGYRAADDPIYHPVILHWNGLRWRGFRIHGATCPGGCLFDVVTASARNDVLAFSTTPHLTGPVGKPYVARWDGTNWQWGEGKLRPIPVVGDVRAAAELGPSDLWVSGAYNGELAHWNGKAWQFYTPPGFGLAWQFAPISERDIWATLFSQAIPPVYLMRWSGSSWNQVALPRGATFTGVSAPLIAFSGKNNGYILGGQDSRRVYRWDNGSWHLMLAPLWIYRGGLDPKVAFFAQAIPDNTGGFWAYLASDPIFHGRGRLVHYSHGHWTAVMLPPLRLANGALRHTYIDSMAQVPGSSYIWVSIGYIPNDHVHEPVEDIFTYKP
jgi:hypothetical protein